LKEGEINFYYGSENNYFWYIIKQVFEPNYILWPRTARHCKDFLKEYRLGIGDILSSFKRQDRQATDSALSEFVFNDDLIATIMAADNSVKYLYFTSKFAYRLFKQAVRTRFSIEETKTVDKLCFQLTITSLEQCKSFNTCILKSPSPRGRHTVEDILRDWQGKFTPILDLNSKKKC
jgi:G:T/U-mismatch repair DNA glycosylase